jgi:mannose-1-phosphate guanylyltransferase
MKAVILAAGLGTRLQPYTFLIPKPMLPLGNKPLLEHIIEWLKESKKTDQIVLCVSYLHTIIEDYFEDGKRFGIKIEYSKTPIPMGQQDS